MKHAEKPLEIALDDTRKLVCANSGEGFTFTVLVLNKRMYEPETDQDGKVKPPLKFHEFGSIADFNILLTWIGRCDNVGKLCMELANFGRT